MCMTWGDFKAKAEAAGVKDDTKIVEIVLYGDETELDIDLQEDTVTIEGVDDLSCEDDDDDFFDDEDEDE